MPVNSKEGVKDLSVAYFLAETHMRAKARVAKVLDLPRAAPTPSQTYVGDR